ncbi:MAG: hypothetical protein ACKJRP_04010 [SAR86 cluster bacterium]|tara:strand:- start:28936 stop:29436 length:501 start_codon:yes stop_codon:yes gene_type:complete
MKETVSGSIARMGQNQKSFILQEQDGKWFGAFAVDQLQGANLGDKVQFFYESVEKNGRTFNNIKGNVSVLGKTSPPSADALSSPSLSREWLILRQNALTNAVNFTANNPNSDSTVEAVLETAAEFVAWTSGDSEKLELEEGGAQEKGEPTVADWKEAAVELVKAAS